MTSLERCSLLPTTATNHWYSTPSLSTTPSCSSDMACTPGVTGGSSLNSSAGVAAASRLSVLTMVSSTGYESGSGTDQKMVGFWRGGVAGPLGGSARGA